VGIPVARAGHLVLVRIVELALVRDAVVAEADPVAELVERPCLLAGDVIYRGLGRRQVPALEGHKTVERVI